MRYADAGQGQRAGMPRRSETGAQASRGDPYVIPPRVRVWIRGRIRGRMRGRGRGRG